MEDFQNAIIDCNMLELLYSGSRFTWHRGTRDDVIYERLDRCLASQGWFNLFSSALKIIKLTWRLIILPLLLDYCHKPRPARKKLKKFKYENL